MLVEFERVITGHDRSRLKASLKPPRSFWNEWGRRLLVQVIMLAVACFVIAWVISWGFALLIAVLYVGFDVARGATSAALRAWREIRLQESHHEQLTAALARADSIHVTRVESEAVVAVPHDFGILFLFDLGDGRWFAFEAPSTCARWPNSAFEIFRLPGSQEDFGPVCNRRQLPVKQSLEFKDFDFDSIPDDGVIAGPVEALLAPPPEAT